MARRRPKTKQITIRVEEPLLDKLDEFVALAGGSRASLVRGLIEEFAGKADALIELLKSARKGAEADAVLDWVREIMEGLNEDVGQLSMPVRSPGEGAP